jgi:hypothetical protein
MLAGAIPATLLAFYFEEAFGRLEHWATPKGLTIGERERNSGGLLGLLAAAATLPLVFGVLLPWTTATGAEGEAIILTGLHPEYRAIGLPILLLGLVATMWPRRGERGQEWPLSLLTTGAGVLTLLWMLVGVYQVLTNRPAGSELGVGLFVQAAASLFIAAITIVEFIWSLRDTEQEVLPKGEPAVTGAAT